MLQEPREDAEYRRRGITLLFALKIERAIELNRMFKEGGPTTEGGWTPLHFIRMRLMEPNSRAPASHQGRGPYEFAMGHSKDGD